MPPLDDPPPFQRGLRFAVRAAVTFSLASGAGDVASQHAPPNQRAIWFGLAGGTTALIAWKGWSWLSKLAGGASSRRR